VAEFDPLSGPREPKAPGLAQDEVALLLGATARIVEAELGALGDGLAGWRPGPGEWCANEVVGHLVEADARGYGGRIRRILAAPPGTEPTEPGWDEPTVAAARADCEKPAAILVDELSASRRDAVELVLSLTQDDLGRGAIHAAVGRVTVAELLQEWCTHDRLHLQQLLKSVQARAWPVMGNTRRFLRDEPPGD
jgi:DinB family protein